MRRNFSGHRHDGGDAHLVVGAEKRRSVREDDVFARVLRDLREVGRPEDDVLLRIENDVSALIAQDLRLYVFARSVRRRIHMRDEADRGTGLAPLRRGNFGVDDAAIAHTGIFETEGLQFLNQSFGELQLLRRGRSRAALTCRLRIEAHVAKESRLNRVRHDDFLLPLNAV